MEQISTIQINACQDCKIINCLVSPTIPTKQEIVGAFVCRDCLTMKSWNQSMRDDRVPRIHSLREPDESEGPHGILTSSRGMLIKCPYGRQATMKFGICVDCFQRRSQKMYAIAKLADKLKLNSELADKLKLNSEPIRKSQNES